MNVGILVVDDGPTPPICLRSPLGHEDAFPPPTLSNRSRLGKPTFAKRRGEQDAPTAVVRENSQPLKVED